MKQAEGRVLKTSPVFRYNRIPGTDSFLRYTFIASSPAGTGVLARVSFGFVLVFITSQIAPPVIYNVLVPALAVSRLRQQCFANSFSDNPYPVTAVVLFTKISNKIVFSMLR